MNIIHIDAKENEAYKPTKSTNLKPSNSMVEDKSHIVILYWRL